MTRNPADLARQAEKFEAWADQLDPEHDDVTADDTRDLAAIAEAADAVAAAQARLRQAVEVARAHGRSWNRIAIPLGVSRQAARERFAADESDLETAMPVETFAGMKTAQAGKLLASEPNKPPAPPRRRAPAATKSAGAKRSTRRS